MAMDQPVLSADQWKATVTKMKDVYKAPVVKAYPAIVDYLTAMSAFADGAPTGKAQDTALRHRRMPPEERVEAPSCVTLRFQALP
jgi:hypothetical protein